MAEKLLPTFLEFTASSDMDIKIVAIQGLARLIIRDSKLARNDQVIKVIKSSLTSPHTQQKLQALSNFLELLNEADELSKRSTVMESEFQLETAYGDETEYVLLLNPLIHKSLEQCDHTAC